MMRPGGILPIRDMHGARTPRRRLVIDALGIAATAAQIASPNQDDRPSGSAISLIVVHGISLPPGRFGGDGVARLFTNTLDPGGDPCYRGIADLRVSSHFFIRRDGELVQFVACERRAWHAGVSSWRGRAACNDYSVGIELEGTDDLP
jgi:AmpD protein